MIARIIFFVSVLAAILAVILLATISPLPKRSHKNSSANYNWISLSLYVQPYSRGGENTTRHGEPVSAYIFIHRLTTGSDHTSSVVGHITGFVLPQKESVLSSFDILHLALFDMSELSGSLCIEVRQAMRGRRRVEELKIVGGTGSFAFAGGDASLTHAAKIAHASGDAESRYMIKLRIRLPDSQQNTIPG